MVTRREFLKVAGIAGAGAAAGAAGGYAFRALSGPLPGSAIGGELAIYNWSYYLFEPLLDEFRRQTGVSAIRYDTFESGDQVWQALQRAPSGYDLVLLVDRYVPEAVAQGYILPIDARNVPNLDLVLPTFEDLAYDPEHSHSVPYVWGTTGIGVNTAAVAGAVTSWADLFDVPFLQANFKKVTMLDDMRETLAAALLLLGHGVNTTVAADLYEARDRLIEQKPYLAKYASAAEYMAALPAGDWAASHAWNGDVVQMRLRAPQVHYVVPTEGAVLWVDNFVVPAGARNKAAAEAFINFMLEPANETLNSEYIGYPNANRLSYDWLPESFRTDPAIYPDPTTMAKLRPLQELDPATLAVYEAVWQTVSQA